MRHGAVRGSGLTGRVPVEARFWRHHTVLQSVHFILLDVGQPAQRGENQLGLLKSDVGGRHEMHILLATPRVPADLLYQLLSKNVLLPKPNLGCRVEW